jgi:hypothetical protein
MYSLSRRDRPSRILLFVPEGQLRIARRFNGGRPSRILLFVPEGQLRIARRFNGGRPSRILLALSPVGTAEDPARPSLSRPYGTTTEEETS